MRPTGIAGGRSLLLLVVLLCGCDVSLSPRFSVTMDMVVGEYVFVSVGGFECERIGDRLTLRPDDTYVLIRASGQGKEKEETGAWSFKNDEGGEIVLLTGDRGVYNVVATFREIRLVFDSDRELWFRKPRKTSPSSKTDGTGADGHASPDGHRETRPPVRPIGLSAGA